jgi:hypothetical protein
VKIKHIFRLPEDILQLHNASDYFNMEVHHGAWSYNYHDGELIYRERQNILESLREGTEIISETV